MVESAAAYRCMNPYSSAQFVSKSFFPMFPGHLCGCKCWSIEEVGRSRYTGGQPVCRAHPMTKDQAGVKVMAEQVNRREFLKTTMAAAAGATGLADTGRGANPPAEAPGANGMPMGRIKNLRISRLISGGNLISGWAHARDLIYVHHLMNNYNTEAKVLETLAVLEENGVNTIIADPRKKPMEIFKKHWSQGGKIQWIAEGHPTPEDPKTNIKASVDWGASAVYLQGVIGDRWLKEGHVEKLGECVEYIKSLGVPGGLGAHLLDVIINSEALGFDPDFYVKTLHHTNYWSARRPDQGPDVVGNRADNFWEPTPEKTIEFMKTVQKPWI
ncbi:MAG: twin-arginine translocation signal domain-containing protein, partial [Planctomycetes bacterium]|nr:twin-arginine translocation signal domain-containing protein [Planctomycetota bacterium]